MARDTFYSAQFPAGEYYVGDLCYVMTPEWDELWEIRWYPDTHLEGELTVQNKRIFIASTAYGDGNFDSNSGHSFGVDSGSLGIISINDISPSELENLHLGHVFEFPQNFTVTANNGKFQFGDILIDTGYDEEYDEGYLDEGYDDYWYESRYETDY